MIDNFRYVGKELDLFPTANNWKSYWTSKIMKYLKGNILEVGAGIGSNTEIFLQSEYYDITCLEPDAALASRLQKKINDAGFADSCKVIHGTTASINFNHHYDSILYIDVIEHIEEEKKELKRASILLNKGGNLIVLSPAHNWLYSPFDKAIGHYRRYNKKSLLSTIPKELRKVELIYLDSIGLWASVGNKLFLKESMPTIKQIQFWDKKLVPISRLIDPLTRYNFGKSVLGIWKKQ